MLFAKLLTDRNLHLDREIVVNLFKELNEQHISHEDRLEWIDNYYDYDKLK